MSKPINRVAIIGMGALGVLYGNHFTAGLGKEQVTFLVDAVRLKRYQQQETYCNGKVCDFSFQDVVEAKEPLELLIVSVKYTTLLQAMETVKHLIDKNTIIISVLNGISSEELIEDVLGMGMVIPCIAQGMDAVKSGSEVTYSRMGTLCVGLLKETGEQKEALERITSFFQRTNLPYVEEPDMLRRLWGKWMLNVGLNQTVMIWEGTYDTIQQPGEARDRMIAAMREVLLLAKAENVPIGEADLQEYLELTDTLSPKGMPSMRQDGLAKRYSEVEMFAGTVIEKGAKYGIPVPVNEAFYKTVKEIERGYEPT